MRLPSRARFAPAALFAATTLYAVAAAADNPIVQTSYTADPAPMLHDGRLYLYTSHDEDVTVNDFFTMNDWRLYSTLDMVNWTDHGSPASYASFSWGTGDAWAPHGIGRNGKFYLYLPVNNATGSKIGVLVADQPTGPFTDPLGKALIATGSGNIDPTVFIDGDDQAYLYWGNPDLYYVKLNPDMISFAGSPTKVSLTTAGFGARSKTDRATAYEEGPWFYKRDALYYLVFPADSTPEKISYSTSSGPLGPWMFRGDIMAKQTGAGASFTNHPAVIDYKGHSFFFYHNGALPGGGGYKRSVCVEELEYGADGAIPTVTMSSAGPKAVANLNPFVQVEAETIAYSSGLKTEVCSEGGMNVTSIGNGDYIKVKNVDFGSGVDSFDARVAAAASGGSIELHLDSLSGELISTCAIPSTGGAKSWMTTSCAVSGATGLHDVFLKFVGGSGDLFDFNWWKLRGPGSMDPQNVDPEGGAGGTDGSGGQSTPASGGSAGTVASGGTAPSGGRAPSGGGTSGGGGAPTSTGGSSTSGTGVGESGAPPTSHGSKAGCDCSSTPSGQGTSPVLVALLAGVLWRRRKHGFE